MASAAALGIERQELDMEFWEGNVNDLAEEAAYDCVYSGFVLTRPQAPAQGKAVVVSAVAALDAYTRRPETIIGLPRVIQVWGRRAA